MSSNRTHSFNIEHVQYIGLTASIVYEQIHATSKMVSVTSFQTNIGKLNRAMPYFKEHEIVGALHLLSNHHIIAFEFRNEGKELVIASVNDPIDTFLPEEEDC